MKYLKEYKWNLMLGVALFVAFAFGMLPPEAMAASFLLNTSTAQLGNGTILQISTGSPTTFVSVANAHDVSWDDGTNPQVEVTNLLSPAKEFLPGLADSGKLTANVDMDMGDPGQIAIQAAKLSRIACDVKVILPGGLTPTWTARGFITKFGKQLGVDNAVKASLEIVITGAWVNS